MENTTISESNKGEIETLDPLHVDSMINITGSNLSYECGIENSLLNQTWIGRWTLKGRIGLSVCTCYVRGWEEMRIDL